MEQLVEMGAEIKLYDRHIAIALLSGSNKGKLVCCETGLSSRSITIQNLVRLRFV